MKARLLVLTLILFWVFVAEAAEYYKLKGVKRIEKDLYRTSDGLYIETQCCFHYTYAEDAILKWDFAGSIDNKIIWNDDTTCQVKKTFKK